MIDLEIQETRGVGLDDVVGRSHDWFRREQFDAGYWWAELESNATMDAEYVLMTHFLGARDDGVWRGVAMDIRSYQRADGSWALYDGAPGDLSTTIECYFALKLAGDVGPHLERAKRFIIARGGIAHARVFTRVWLALCGEWSWDDLPVMPLELMLLPARAPISIYRFASWARAPIVPLLILMNERPVRPVPASASLADLRIGAPVPLVAKDAIDRLFIGIDHVLRMYQRVPWHPLRARARAAAETWILEHQEADGSWGGIQPPWVYSLMALSSLGHDLDHPAIRQGLDGMHDRWMIRRDDGSLRLQPCLSPVWDSALSLVALLESGFAPSAPAVQSCAQWLLAEEVRRPGDWCVWVPDVEPSGWSFEFDNDLYPDIDDTALVVIGLHKAGVLDQATRARADRLGARDAERERRLGGVRQGQHLAIAGDDPVRRFRRDDRSAERGCHRACHRDVRDPRVRSQSPRDRQGARLPLRAARERRIVVRPLGREPHLRGRCGAAGTRRRRRTDGWPRGPARGALARRAPELRRWIR